MALLGSDFNPTTPRDTDPVANGASEIRDIKRRLKDFVTVKFDPETGNFKSASSNITLASADPTNPNLGDVYFNTVSLTAFVFTTGGWVPIQNSNLPQALQTFSASGSFTVPAGIQRLKIHAWGAGGGGSSTSGGGANGSGGGGGAYGSAIVVVTSGQIIPLVIGTGGGTGASGGATTILGMSAGGGTGAVALNTAGVGGTASGFDVNFSGQSGNANSGSDAGFAGSAGGDAGGWGGKGGTSTTPTPSNAGAGTSPGGGGGGGTASASSVGGAGANGAIVIEY